MLKSPHLILTSNKTRFPKLKASDGQFCWVFLGRDSVQLSKLKTNCPSQYCFVDIGGGLNETSYEIRRPYLDFIGSQSICFASLAWWLTCISEKNVMTSPAFLYICYLEVLRKLKDGELKNKNVCIFCDSPALLETISRSTLFKDYVVSRYYQKRNASVSIRILINIARFFFRGLTQKMVAALTSKERIASLKRSSLPLIIMRTWASENNLAKNGVFEDTYFADLYERLRLKNKNVAIIPIFYSIKRSFKEALCWLGKSKFLFVVPEDFYALSDYIKAMEILGKSYFCFINKTYVFNGFDLSLIYKEAMRQKTFGPTCHGLMHYFLVKRLYQKGINIERFIITFENASHEKPFILAIKKYYPKAKVIGFQHAALLPLELNLFTSKQEATVLPMPHKIVCTGKFFKEILAKEGFPEDRLLMGPALRYQYLLQSNNLLSFQRPKNIVLVTLPLFVTGAYELLFKSWDALKDLPQVKMWIKPHPMMPASQLSNIIDKISIPAEDCVIVREKMGNLLHKVTMLIATGSSTILDAVAYGLPVIRVRSDVDLTLDPMDWFTPAELDFVARTPEEILFQTRRALALDDRQLRSLKGKGGKLIADCFSPVNEETLSAFI